MTIILVESCIVAHVMHFLDGPLLLPFNIKHHMHLQQVVHVEPLNALHLGLGTQNKCQYGTGSYVISIY